MPRTLNELKGELNEKRCEYDSLYDQYEISEDEEESLRLATVMVFLEDDIRALLKKTGKSIGFFKWDLT